MFDTIISPDQLNEIQATQRVLIWDISYKLTDADWGRSAFEEEHIPGATYIDIHDDLCAGPGFSQASGGRHPLPTREDFARTLGRLGVTPDTQVIVYDRNKSSFCCRAWWMLRWVGHQSVAVLDGGLKAWKLAGFPVESGAGHTPVATDTYPLQEPLVELWTIDQVKANLTNHEAQLFDCRAPERYRGEVEPLDPRAGHIPGALNRPFQASFDKAGCFLPAETLSAELNHVLPTHQPCVAYCGSGVSATPLVLAAQIAGLPLPALFAGSFSEWSCDAQAPVATGAEE